MSFSKIQIYNVAVGMVGGTRLTSTDDDIKEATILNDVWPIAVLDVLESRDWSFARTVKQLTPVPDPLDQGRSTFQVPTDCATLRHVGDSYDADNELDWTIENEVLVIPDGATSVWARYTRKITDVSKFSASFASALIARLASELALPVTNSVSMFEGLGKLYAARLILGTTNDSMQGKNTPFKPGKLQRARVR